MADFAKNLPKSPLKHLSLRNNKLHDAGIATLAAALPASKLHVLELSYNTFSEMGATALAAVLPQTTIKRLELRFALELLGQRVAMSWAVLIADLDSQCKLGATGGQALFSMFPAAGVEFLDLLLACARQHATLSHIGSRK
eukprot:m.211845 g.211845  ORF g.211845 m.211845 type:complete len:141 (+) comp10748_c0_seq5:467-889(+)